MRKILKHPFIVIGLSILITVIFAIPLRKIKIESSIRQFFPQEHEAFQRLNKTEDQFGSMLAIGISLETPGETILTKEYVDLIRKITSELKTVQNTDDVKSITNVDFIEGKEGTIEVAPLLDKDDSEEITDEDVALIQERLTSWEDMYNLVVISNNRRASQIVLSVNQKASLAEQATALTDVRKIVFDNLEKAKSDLSVRFYGDPVISENSKAFMLSDLTCLIPLVVLVVLISLYFSFSTKEGTILPLITVLMSTVWSIGIMTLLGFEFSMVSSVIPVALIGCGSAYGIHVLTHYYIAVDAKRKELDAKGEKFTKELHFDCIIEGLKNVQVAIVLSAVTTIVGFMSLVTSPLKPLFSFAIFTGTGIGFSLLLSVTVVPAFLVLKKLEDVGKRSKRMEKITKKVRRKIEKIEAKKIEKLRNEIVVQEVINKAVKNGSVSVQDITTATKTAIETLETKASGLADSLYNIYHAVCGTKPRLIIFSLVIIILSAIGLSRIVIDTSMVNYFPETCKLRQDINYVNDNFAGTSSIHLLIKSPANPLKEEANALYDEAQKLEDKYANAEIPADIKAKIDELRSKADEKFTESRNALDMTNPEILKAVDLMEKWITDKYDVVGKAASYTDSIKRINQVWNAPGAQSSSTSDVTSDSVDFQDDLSFDDFGDDAFGDSTTSTTDDFGSFYEFEDESTSETTVDIVFEDPNIAYQAKLDRTMTGKEIQDFIANAYSKAGGKSASIEEFVKTLQKEMNYTGVAFYEIPYNPAKYQKATRQELSGIISNYTQLLGDSLERFTDDQTNYTPTSIKMQVQIKTNSTQVLGKMLNDFEDYAKTHFPEGYFMEATGEGEMEYVMTNLVVSSQVMSLIISLSLVFIIITISFKSPIAGIIGAIPLAFTIILNYMVMGLFNIKLDLFTSIIASVAIGVGIDYTIHFMTEYKALRMESDDLEEVTRGTFKSSGMGIITNALAVGLGFMVLILSRFVVLQCIGILIAIVMFTSSMLAMTVLPAIFNNFDPKFMHPGKPKAWETEEEVK